MRVTPCSRAFGKDSDVLPVSLVPRKRGHAAVAALVMIIILVLTAALASWSLHRLDEVDVPGQVAISIIGAFTVLAFLLYAVSLVAFVLPRLAGVRRAPTDVPTNDPALNRR